MALEKGYTLTDIRDRYEILEKIHCGGQGNVVRAVRKEDNQPLILKLYHEGEITSWDELEKANEGADKEIKFLKRAESHSREDVPQIIEYGTFGALEQPYLAMKEVAGRDLESLVNKPGSNPTLEEAMKLASEIAQTLNYAHKEAGSRPFVHRDLKPSSIIMTGEGHYVVVDWGTVKCGTGKTQFTTQFDSLYYTSPEVRFGEEVNPSADVYSLARILQHSLLGRRFLEKHGEVDRSDFAGLNVSDSFIDILLSAADNKAEKRPQSMAEFLHRLQEKKELVVAAASNNSTAVKERLPSTSSVKAIDQNYKNKEELPTTLKFLYTNSGSVEGHLLMFIGGLSIANSVGGDQGTSVGGVNIANSVGEDQFAGLGAVNIAESVGGDQFAVLGAVVNYAKSVGEDQWALIGIAVNVAETIGGSQCAGLGAINIAESVGRDQFAILGAAVNIAKNVEGDQGALIGIAVNVAENVGGSQYGLVNIVTKELKKRQIGVINYANGSEFKQYGLLNFRPGKVWWNPEVSLFYYNRKKAVQAKQLRVELEALVDEELNRIEVISDDSYAEHTLLLEEEEEHLETNINEKRQIILIGGGH